MTGSATWEYLTIPETDRHRLIELGSEGWELVGVGGSPEERVLYLKRPGQDLRERVTAEQRGRYYESLGLDPRGLPERGPA